MKRLGHYEVQRRLGKGGMGEVVLARDRRDGSVVALKVLAPELARDEEARERFVAEAELGRSVLHPVLVEVLDQGEVHLRGADRTLFLAMELAPGRELIQVLSVEEIPLDRVLGITNDLADALGALHGAGFAHRDLKSGNVRVASDGGVKLLDLGLAAPIGRATPGEVGTLHYAAPEQLTGGEIGEAADVYALGVVLYQMVTGRLPFRGETAEQVVAAAAQRRMKRLERLVEGTPEGLQELIDEMTRFDPGDRPALPEVRASVADLREEARALAADTSPDELPASRFRSWLRRRRR